MPVFLEYEHIGESKLLPILMSKLPAGSSVPLTSPCIREMKDTPRGQFGVDLL